jgi:hypothetical protein
MSIIINIKKYVLECRRRIVSTIKTSSTEDFFFRIYTLGITYASISGYVGFDDFDKDSQSPHFSFKYIIVLYVMDVTHQSCLFYQ